MLKLKEMLWEITPECNKKCEYCGSKNLRDKERLPDDALVRIATSISEYAPEAVTITGGEPGTLSRELLQHILSIFISNNIRVSIVTNGLCVGVITNADIAKHVWIGHSVNAIEDTHVPIDVRNFKGVTMITNVGTHNIWTFNELYEHSKFYNYWQIQLTMGEFQLPADGISYLRNKLSTVDETNIVRADNFQDVHDCVAGLNSCSVLYTGDVVACLSARCYAGGKIPASEGNLLSTSLKEIWETQFRRERFWPATAKHCRNYITYPESTPKNAAPVKPASPSRDDVYVYGVFYEHDDKLPINSYPNITMYGVFGTNK